MRHSFKLIVPAIVALSMFTFAPVQAGDGKNGEIEINKNGGGETSKSGGGGESGKNDPQPPSDNQPNPNDPSDGKNDPPSGDGKNDPQPPAPPPPSNPPSGGKRHSSFTGGSSTDYNSGLITCVVNGRVFKVRDIRKCYTQPTYGDYQPRPPVYHAKKKHRRVAVSGGMNYGDCGCATGGGYVYAPQPIIRYYKPASRAAVMQQQKRARRAAAAAAAYGYSYGGDYGYDAGYSYEGSYAVTRKKHRRVQYNAPIYMPSYDQGYVVHYGPTMSKDGGY